MWSLAICDALGIETSQTATLTIREPQKESDLEAEGDDSGESPGTESLLKSLTPFAIMSIYRVELHRYDGM